MESGNNNSTLKHTIRLRGPCKLAWMRAGTQMDEVKVQIPCQLDSDLFQIPALTQEDTFVLRRNFGKPTGLSSSQNVTLELSNFENARRVLLNHKKNQEVVKDFEENSVSVLVTDFLQINNQVCIEFSTLPARAGSIELCIDGSEEDSLRGES